MEKTSGVPPHLNLCHLMVIHVLNLAFTHTVAVHQDSAWQHSVLLLVPLEGIWEGDGQLRWNGSLTVIRWNS